MKTMKSVQGKKKDQDNHEVEEAGSEKGYDMI